ncbi:hypothetical protein KEM60_03203 [Austwickia sp. TVS 96-490-7B]|uniref:DoxX family protein n=1 Tax=Austwickia sp. TVS 96-490-7B TaxID=2830843 RepID=UPI001C585FD5|nr:hypothetical protein [Austwickia sp. TVS 96-490-7B]MBW3086973.1 hypothetical protein [Austwickia sp. TVS 96-490-7B]
MKITARTVGRVALGALLIRAGMTHFGAQRREYAEIVPDWFPVDKDATVAVSGVAEIAQGAALIALPSQQRKLGCLAAAFLVAVFPANIWQYTQRKESFGMDDDRKRLIRLAIQPAFIAWSLWATGACQGSCSKGSKA